MTRARAVNYALYQTGWFACILGAAWDRPVIGALLAGALIAAHFVVTDDRRTELRLLLLTLAIGLVAEAIQVHFGTYAFRSGVVVAWMSPPWLLLMWAQFATTFRASMRAIMTVPAHAAVFGALGGPIAFIAGERLGAVTLAVPVAPALLRLAVVWGVALAACAHLARAATAASPPAGPSPPAPAPAAPV